MKSFAASFLAAVYCFPVCFSGSEVECIPAPMYTRFEPVLPCWTMLVHWFYGPV